MHPKFAIHARSRTAEKRPALGPHLDRTARKHRRTHVAAGPAGPRPCGRKTGTRPASGPCDVPGPRPRGGLRRRHPGRCAVRPRLQGRGGTCGHGAAHAPAARRSRSTHPDALGGVRSLRHARSPLGQGARQGRDHPPAQSGSQSRRFRLRIQPDLWRGVVPRRCAPAPTAPPARRRDGPARRTLTECFFRNEIPCALPDGPSGQALSIFTTSACGSSAPKTLLPATSTSAPAP